MASFKFPDIGASALEVSKAIAKLVEVTTKVRETAKIIETELKSKTLIFKVRVVSIFPKWYILGGPTGVTIVEEKTIQTDMAFTSEAYVKDAIKEKILEFEKEHEAKYQALLEVKYKGLYTYDGIIPNTHYILEVNIE